MSDGVKPIGQRDPEWANHRLGMSKVTIGGYGCAITCLAMWLNAVKAEAHPDLDPLTVNEYLVLGGGYRAANLVDWSRLPRLYQEMKYLGRVDCPTTSAPIEQVDALLDKGLPVIVYVDFSHEPGLQQHFVLITHRGEGGEYYINDPWFGDQSTLCPRYGQTAKAAICGIILLETSRI